MIIDAHAHITAPDQLYVWKAGLLSHRGAHGRYNPDPRVSDDQMLAALNKPTFGTKSHLDQLKEVGTDMQILSPRPYQMMHSERPGTIVHWYNIAVNDMIAQQCRLFPDVFRGMCGLPQVWGEPIEKSLPELERCVTELGMVGCLLNPDPSEGLATLDVPDLGQEYWYPLYEKLVALDVPAYIHSAGCRTQRHSYSLHFILEETIAVMALIRSNVFKDFPTLKIVVPHGGGAIPFQFGRFHAPALRRGPEPFRDSLRRIYFDTVLYSEDALAMLIKTVGADRILFGAERPGVGTVKDPATGRWLDDIAPIIQGFSWLAEDEKRQIFEGNARRLFRLDASARKAA
ncbi:4-oxalmesaconate hydratase [Rhizobiales bacterium GAS191]|jgi:OH-DDVA meta-cleavage compound hydrolase|nr:4-oxalmesaconate hydratase [Rhizobiales bacterium GAS191]